MTCDRDLRAVCEQRDDVLANGLAKRIVRDEVGAEHAREVDQLAEVDGIGPARLARLRDLVTV